MSIGRNDPCPCGSGRKHKDCCATRTAAARTSRWAAVLLGLALLVGVLIVGRALIRPASTGPTGPAPPGKVWSEEHGHWH